LSYTSIAVFRPQADIFTLNLGALYFHFSVITNSHFWGCHVALNARKKYPTQEVCTKMRLTKFLGLYESPKTQKSALSTSYNPNNISKTRNKAQIDMFS